MSRIMIAVLFLAALSGCATAGRFVERHPIVTGIGIAVVAGSIAASLDRHHGRAPGDRINPPNCAADPQSCR